MPDWVVVPVSRGDGLFGVWCGFVELAELGWTSKVPRLLAVERHPSLTDALARHLEQPELVRVDGQVKARSISDPQGAGMSVHAIRASGGDTVVGDDEQIQAAWERLAASGVLLELSSAAVLHGAQVLADRGAIDGESTVVLLATAGPYSQQTLDGPPAGRRVEDPTDAAALRAATAQSTGA